MFDAFKKELTSHPDGCYHYSVGPLERREVDAWFQGYALRPPADYVDFLCEVGPGSFFGGALDIYPLSSRNSRSVDSEIGKLRQATADPVFPFGYDGTTESCYCLDSGSGNHAVYWFSWEEKVKRLLSPRFQDWMEGRPKELFNPRVYAGYKKLTNVDKLVAVMEDRSAFAVKLVRFDMELQRPPDKPNDFLRRYNRVVMEVIKTRPVTIPVLTIMIARLGSKLGAANVEYATIPVNDIPVGLPTLREIYVFDPFNVPFSDIAVKFNPVIDLGSKMRVKFKELSPLLG